MSVKYTPVQWNPNKYVYDLVALAGIALYIVLFLKYAPMEIERSEQVNYPILRMRAFGTCAFILLSLILCIGPLARLDRRFLPLLYNRRHLGVLTFAVALTHASYVIDWYYVFSPTDRYVALLTSNVDYGQFLGFPFEAFGIFSLFVLLVLAVTSHDFWLKFFTPPFWKALHMIIYVGYTSLVAHVLFGYMQGATDPIFPILVVFFSATVLALHIAAGKRETDADRITAATVEGDWINVARLDEIEDEHGHMVPLPGGERIAIFRYDGKLSATSNACAHQNGPLGEGRIVDGCITCPWHGFQYRPEDGRAPAPFTEKIATYRLQLRDGDILVDPKPNPPGTHVDPVRIGESA
ncbi:ferric reductase-like transmembrane domain-containing protein [Parvibaculaceae bacterium PLY_AMNH_Bact1]|nr:ferric reductase-like transmembrane domain-containing protein [Parvibaculaceae bacterium PLY_AMNH_Bact1]